MAKTEVLGRNESDFRLEYGENVPDQALVDDVVSYLGEYRFNLPKYSYTLKFSNGKLKDPHRGEPMRDLTQRALEKKISEGNFCLREMAEMQGFINLDRQLISAKENDTVVWASPPGQKEDGYGDYGFIFIGHVNINNVSEKIVEMTALRVENPKIEQFNQALSLILGEKIENTTPEDFLKSPKVKAENLQDGFVDAILGISFAFKSNMQEQKKFELIIQKMFPLISDFIRSAKNPFKTKAEKIKELYALENYALKLENVVIDFKSNSRLPDIVEEYGYKPPQVAGSCPVNTNNKTSKFTTSNILSKGSILNSILEDEIDYEFDQDGPCKKCNADIKCGPCGICKACDLAIRAREKFSLN